MPHPTKPKLSAIVPAALTVALMLVVLVASSALFVGSDDPMALGPENSLVNGIKKEPDDTIDVLFIGDSESYSSFCPPQMWHEHGFTSYVCGTGAQTLAYVSTMLERATENQSPKVVVLETNCVYSPFGGEAALMRALQDVFPVLSYHERWKGLVCPALAGNIGKSRMTTQASDVEEHVVDFKGFRINKDAEAADSSHYMEESSEVAKLNTLNRLYLDRIRSYCQSIGAELVLMSVPSTKNWNTARHNGIEKVADEMDLPYVDLNTEPNKVEIDWKKDTRDKGDHLNLSGATKVSAYVGEYLATEHGLANRQSDPRYADWNDEYSLYEEKILRGEGDAGPENTHDTPAL